MSKILNIGFIKLDKKPNIPLDFNIDIMLENIIINLT